MFSSMLLILSGDASKELSSYEIENRARQQGMVYREEVVFPLERKEVIISQNAGLAEIALQLEDKNLISSKADFIEYVKEQNLVEDLQPGVYELTTGDLEEIVDRISKGGG